MQTTAAYSPWQKGQVEKRIDTIRRWRARPSSPSGGEECHVSCHLRCGPCADIPAARVCQRVKVRGELMEHGEVIPHPTVVDEGDELARRFIIGPPLQR